MIYLFIFLIISLSLHHWTLSVSYYNKTIGDLYELKGKIYDEFSVGETSLKVRDYLLNQIDYNINLLKRKRYYKFIFGLHYFKEYILNDLLGFPMTVEQEDLYVFHRNNISIILNSKSVYSNIVNILKVFSRLTSFNCKYYLRNFIGKK
jgi:hypothetical protein